jgi:hypothetical protein
MHEEDAASLAGPIERADIAKVVGGQLHRSGA